MTLLLLMLFAGCGSDNANKKDIFYPEDRAIDDSLRYGKMEAAVRLIEQAKAAAGDSDVYYHFVARNAAADYYMCQPESILSHSGKAIAYFSSQAPTQMRLKDLSMASQARSSYYQQYTAELDSAIHYQEAGLAAAEKSGLKGYLTTVLANTGDAYRLFGQYDRAADTYRRAAMMADSLKLPKTDYVPIYSGLAAVYTALHNFRESDIWWNRTDSLQPYMMESEKFFFLNNRGNDLYLKKDYPAAYKQFQKLGKFLEGHPEMEWEKRFCQVNTADVLLKLGRTAEAAPLLEESLDFFTNVQPNPYVRSHLLLQKMILLHQQGKNSEVERILAENPIEGKPRPEAHLFRYEFLKDYYADTHQWEKAYQALNLYTQMNDTLRSDRIRMNALEQERRYRRDSQVHELSLTVENQRRHLAMSYLWLAVGVLLLVIIVLGMRIRWRGRERRLTHRVMMLRLESIRSRITPHFIYNALNHEIAARQAGLPGNLDNLVRLLHEQQTMAERPQSTLREEIRFADDYIQVERANVEGEFILEQDIDEGVDLDAFSLPSMSLQIFAENAFKHGFPTLSPTEPRYMRIAVADTPGGIVVSLFNNTGSRAAAPVGKSTRKGLQLIMSSLQQLNSGHFRKMTLAIDPATECNGYKGYKAAITIPHNFKKNAD